MSNTNNITLSYNGHWREEIKDIFMENGLIVIEDVIGDKECDRYMDEIVGSIEKLGTGVDRNDIKTWKQELLPPMTRPGLFQTLIGNSKPAWELRVNERIKGIFEKLYCELKRIKEIELLVSQDGINIHPNGWGKYHKDDIKSDWAHLDITQKDGIYKCLQGQIVLSNTTAGFRASPKSHKCLNKILEMKEKQIKNEKDNWLKFLQAEEEIDILKRMIEEQGGEWQVPILAKKGSLIIWTSALIHSAKNPDRCESKKYDDPWFGWRGVVYISYRPKSEFTQSQIKKKAEYLLENRTMNHWSLKVFPVNPIGRYVGSSKFHPIISKCIQNPRTVYDLWNITDPYYFESMKDLV